MAADSPPARTESALGDPRLGTNPGWLSARQWRVLDAVCRTFQPSKSAADGRLLARVAGLIAALPNAEDCLRLQLRWRPAVGFGRWPGGRVRRRSASDCPRGG